jgi:hypothetical protein
MAPLGHWRIEQAWRSLPSADQHLLKLLEGGRIRSELCARAVDGAVRLSLVTLNRKFRPRHKLLQFSKPVSERRGCAPSMPDSRQKSPDCQPRPACYLSGLAFGEEHHESMITFDNLFVNRHRRVAQIRIINNSGPVPGAPPSPGSCFSGEGWGN